MDSTANRSHLVRAYCRPLSCNSVEISGCSALACGESEHECQDEGGNLGLPITLDHTEFLGVLLVELGWKETTETTDKTSRVGLFGQINS